MSGDVAAGAVRAIYEAIDAGPSRRGTSVARVFERGCLRLRHPRGATCRAVLVNTAGGVVAGDRLCLDIELGPRAQVTWTSTAAEKVYRSEGADSVVETRLTLGPGSRCTWIPHETILFDKARFRRRFEIDLAADADLFSAEMVVFGRRAHGERDIAGWFRDSWRVRRGGRLIYADETRIEERLGSVLAGSAVAAGASAMASILVAAPDPSPALDRIREAIAALSAEAAGGRIEGGASLREGIIIARLLAQAPERLRTAIVTICAAVGSHAVPRDWL